MCSTETLSSRTRALTSACARRPCAAPSARTTRVPRLATGATLERSLSSACVVISLNS
jgi:hypothetical protein